VLKRVMQSTGSYPPREPYYVKLSYAYFRMIRLKARGREGTVFQGLRAT